MYRCHYYGWQRARIAAMMITSSEEQVHDTDTDATTFGWKATSPADTPDTTTLSFTFFMVMVPCRCRCLASPLP